MGYFDKQIASWRRGFFSMSRDVNHRWNTTMWYLQFPVTFLDYFLKHSVYIFLLPLPQRAQNSFAAAIWKWWYTVKELLNILYTERSFHNFNTTAPRSIFFHSSIPAFCSLFYHDLIPQYNITAKCSL